MFCTLCLFVSPSNKKSSRRCIVLRSSHAVVFCRRICRKLDEGRSAFSADESRFLRTLDHGHPDGVRRSGFGFVGQAASGAIPATQR